MDCVFADAQGKVLANCSFCSLGWVGSPHHVTVAVDGVVTFQHTDHDRSRTHELGQLAVEGAFSVDCVKTFCLAQREVKHLGSDNAQITGFKARENLADQVTLDAIGLDNRESSFKCHASFRVGRFVEKTAQMDGLVSKF